MNVKKTNISCKLRFYDCRCDGGMQTSTLFSYQIIKRIISKNISQFDISLGTRALFLKDDKMRGWIWNKMWSKNCLLYSMFRCLTVRTGVNTEARTHRQLQPPTVCFNINIILCAHSDATLSHYRVSSNFKSFPFFYFEYLEVLRRI